jgi:PiT family inorganic phosphate transporter
MRPGLRIPSGSITAFTLAAMAASGAGLNTSTVKSIALAWVLTLPASIMLAGFLFWFFRQIF